MKSTFVILRSGISGGTATLSIRIGEWLVNQGHDVLYICQNYNDMNNVNSMKEKGVKIYLWELKEISHKLIQEYGRRELNFLTYSLDEYLFVETLKDKINISTNKLYIVHFYGLIKGSNQNIIIKKLVKNFYLKIIENLLDSNSVIFMDNQSIVETEKYYGININKKKSIVMNLPIEVKKFDFTQIKKKVNLKTFNILTIARAEFPFKGYIIGLIDDFQTLCNTYNDITLTVITFGEDEIKISDKIRNLPINVRSKINLIGQTPYNKLHNYFDQAHLYLGMGTTILEAVNHSVPSIAVQSYTYRNNSSGFFHMQPDFLGAFKDRITPAITYIENVIEMRKQEYIELCEIEHKTLAKYYNIETFANYLINIERQVETKIFTRTELKIHELTVNFNKRLNRLNKLKRILCNEGESIN